MTRRRDDLFTATDARFKPRERGRFGDNEYAEPSRGRVTCGADIVDLDLIYARTSESGKAIGIVPFKKATAGRRCICRSRRSNTSRRTRPTGRRSSSPCRSGWRGRRG